MSTYRKTVSLLIFIITAATIQAGSFSFDDYKDKLKKDNVIEPKSFAKIHIKIAAPKEVDFLAAIKINEARILESQKKITKAKAAIVKVEKELPPLQNLVAVYTKRYNDAATYHAYKKIKSTGKRKKECKARVDLAQKNVTEKVNIIEGHKKQIAKQNKNILGYQKKIKVYTMKQAKKVEGEKGQGPE